MKRLAILLALLSSPAMAADDYVPPSKDLWIAMVQAMQNIPMSASGHQQLAQILAGVQQQAKEQSNAKQVPQAGANDGSGGTQPEVRKENGNPAKGR